MRVLSETQRRVPLTLHAYCVMPNHFHLIVGPTLGPNLSAFMHRLTLTHSNRWHRHFGTRGTGPVYQGRFKAFAIENYEYFWAAIQYVQQNPVRAGLVARAEDWPWSSLGSDGRNREGVEVGTWQK
jgi:putative transposase